MGYKIALDDYVYREGDHELLKIADFIKVEVLNRSYVAIEHDIEVFRDYKAVLLAEKIETQKDFEKCLQLGFKLFQGYFLSKPTLISGKKLGQDQQATIRLINTLQSHTSEFSEIEEVISSSASLTYKLLRLLNSSAFSIPNNIDSVSQALTILGLERLKSWGVMLALSNIPSKPTVLSSNALIRSKMCELLGEALALKDYEDAIFTLGLLSTLDIFLDVSLDVIVDSLNLSEWVRKALLNHEGSMGLILHTAICYERADFDSVNVEKLRRLEMSEYEIQSIYERSIVWAADIIDGLS